MAERRRPAASGARLLRAIAARAVALFGLWWVVAEGGVLHQPMIGLAVIGVALATSIALVPAGSSRWTLRPAGLLRFVPFFLRHSLFAGTDVAIRALEPRRTPRLEPALIGFRTRLPAGAPRTFFAAVVSLFPGSLTARLDGDALTVHVLDGQAPTAETLAVLEDRVEALFRDRGG